FSFIYWDTNGDRRVDFQPADDAGQPTTDVQSGLRAWTQFRGYDASVFTQLADFNPNKPPDKGFTFNDLRTEIDNGYPVILFLQPTNQFSRTVGTMTNVNPIIHAMLAYGYYITDTGTKYCRYRNSWDTSSPTKPWGPQYWEAALPVRGVIGYHPRPKIRRSTISEGNLSLQWDGPASVLINLSTATTNRVHGYVVEMSESLSNPSFTDVSSV